MHPCWYLYGELMVRTKKLFREMKITVLILLFLLIIYLIKAKCDEGISA